MTPRGASIVWMDSALGASSARRRRVVGASSVRRVQEGLAISRRRG